MQAIEFQHRLSFRTDYPKPKAQADEALIKIKLSGICSTDLEIVKGYAGFKGILGHEFVGIVEDTGSAIHRHWLGKRVVGSINIGCQRCSDCLNNRGEHCLQRQVLGIRNKQGTFADYITLPVRNLFQVPDSITDESAVFTEPLAAACRILQQIQLSPELKIAVLGTGKLGLLIGQTLAVNNASITMLGRSEKSLALAKKWQLTTGLTSHYADNHFDLVIDASGNTLGFEQALRLTRPRGTLILKSTISTPDPVDLTKLVVAEISLLGSRCGPFDQAIKLLQTDTIPVENMIDGVFKLADALPAFEYASQPGIKKVLLKP